MWRRSARLRPPFGAAVFAGAAFTVLAPRAAHAAALAGPITGWASGVPSYISMYQYVPDRLAANPPILVAAHFCGGSASGMFGESQGGGLIAAADRYGFVMIFPQTTNNCWDVGTTGSLTHNGGGDTQAIAEMVTYALGRYNGNPDRVYVVGTSSGAMMTEALLAVYPDVFKAGAEFSGVPAGCWSVQYSSSIQWSGPCAGGMVSHTAQQWGDLVRGMDASYAGHRPRVQLWHGTADSIINFNNHTEAVKEWTNVLGLSTNPTSTSTVMLNNHQWTRQSWQDACGYTVLDAWAEQNGPHGTDANLNAQYVIPFLGLDQVGPTDPQIAQCGTGAGGSGGASGSGGTSGSAGASGAAGASGGASGTSGSPGGGSGAGAGGSGGSSGAGASGASSGSSGSSGSGALGGAGVGGSAGTGTGASGSSSVSGAGSGAAGSPTGASGDGNAATPAASPLGGCSCAAVGSGATQRAPLGLALLFGLLLSRLVRRRAGSTRRAERSSGCSGLNGQSVRRS